MPLGSFGDKDEPLGNFQLITHTVFRPPVELFQEKLHQIHYSAGLGTLDVRYQIRLLCLANIRQRVVSRLLYLYCTQCVLQSNAALWLIHLIYAFNMDTFVTEPFTVPQHWSDMWEQIPLYHDIKTVDHCSVQTRDTGTARTKCVNMQAMAFKIPKIKLGILFIFIFFFHWKSNLFQIKDY